MVAAALAVSQTMYATRSVTLSDFTATPAEVTASLPDGHVEFTVSFKVENTGDEAINPGVYIVRAGSSAVKVAVM